MMTDAEFADFNRIANAVSNVIGDAIISQAEASESGELDAAAIFYAAVNGALTGAVKVLDATNKAMPMANVDEMFDGMLRQMVDIWGQLRGEPQSSGTVQ